MSTFEHIFIRTDLDPAGLAAELASLMGLEASRDEAGKVYLSRPASDGRPGIIGGEIYGNSYTYPLDDPEEESVIDGYNLVWDLGYSRRDRNVQLDESRRMFRDVTTLGRWPAVLLQGLDLLIAVWSPRSGYHEFPPGTSPDVDHRSLWEQYRQTPST
ncbi:hypothetical protein [Micromonospora sp. WMMD998]|uniref:hypothetical protein n=1 Tax=Micromonospora sp. WMMD998 TaxID=3016092 RepID=UPI00249AAFDC|nr:hypothetical protein [Micromonospora sp. WMMD998]WFE40279.1 hypothetical protein O7619_18270 [Micromonospora sp. WMMD998]